MPNSEVPRLFCNFEFDEVLLPAGGEFAALLIGYGESHEYVFRDGTVYTILS